MRMRARGGTGGGGGGATGKTLCAAAALRGEAPAAEANSESSLLFFIPRSLAHRRRPDIRRTRRLPAACETCGGGGLSDCRSICREITVIWLWSCSGFLIVSPSWGEAVALGFQHYILCLGTVVMIPTLWVPLMSGNACRDKLKQRNEQHKARSSSSTFSWLRQIIFSHHLAICSCIPAIHTFLIFWVNHILPSPTIALDQSNLSYASRLPVDEYIFLAVGRVGSTTDLTAQRVESVLEAHKRSYLMNLIHAPKANGVPGKVLCFEGFFLSTSTLYLCYHFQH